MDLDPDRLLAAFEQAPQALALVDVGELTVLALNRAARALVGRGPLGRPVGDWPGPAARQLAEALVVARATGSVSRARGWRIGQEGSDAVAELRFDVSVVPLLDDGGRPWLLLVTARDVTGDVRGPAGGEVVAELQDAVLPTGLPVPSGARLAARYLLAQDDLGAGGDWFDAVPLPSGAVVLAVGDVVGHGAPASALMAELKAVLEEAAHPDGDLAEVLRALDDRVHRSPEARTTTLCVARFDPSAATLEYVTAGHPPPVLVPASGEATYLPPSGAGPLASGLPYRSARHQLALGDLVLFYTDGLVERPGRTLAQNTVDLLTVAQDVCGVTSDEPLVDRACRLTPEVLTRATGYDDDIALVALQTVPPVAPLELRLPAVPDTVRAARASLGDWLGALGVGALDDTALQHALGELVTNAVEHPYPAPGLADTVDVVVRLGADGMVEIEVRDAGTWREPVPGHGGRGLAMARGFLDELLVEHDASGTRALGRHRVSRPVALLRGAPTASAPAFRPRGRIAVADGVVRLAGPVDRTSAEELRLALGRASWGGVRPVTVELAEVEMLSSAAVQALYDARAAGPVRLVAPLGSPAQHVLDLVRLPYDQP